MSYIQTNISLSKRIWRFESTHRTAHMYVHTEMSYTYIYIIYISTCFTCYNLHICMCVYCYIHIIVLKKKWFMQNKWKLFYHITSRYTIWTTCVDILYNIIFVYSFTIFLRPFHLNVQINEMLWIFLPRRIYFRCEINIVFWRVLQ